MYDRENTLTYEGAINAINSGGSVTHAGKIYTQVNQLPPESGWFTQGNPKRRSEQRARIRKEMADKEIELRRLDEEEDEDTQTAENQRPQGRRRISSADEIDAERFRQQQLDDLVLQQSSGGGQQGHRQSPADNRTAEPEPEFADHPLSFYDNKSDEQVRGVKGVGEATLKEIRTAQRKRDKDREGK